MWDALKAVIDSESMQLMLTNIEKQREHATIYPPQADLFKAFELTPLEDVRVVILGQDPYHQKNQAMGLSFSTSDHKLPKSLINIYKELYDDLGITRVTGDLTDWARQGVFLYNTVLSVQEGEPCSHRGFGWLEFTDAVIDVLSAQERRIIFVLWGKDAQHYETRIADHHVCLKAPHPSPLSSYRGFFGSKPFSKINALLDSPIEWGEL